MQGARHGDATGGGDVAAGRRPLGIGDDDFVAGLDERLEDHVERVDTAGRDHHIVGAVDGDPIHVAELPCEQLEEARDAGRLEVVAVIVVDRAVHRALDGIGRVEAHVPLVQAERILDGVHHVADADDA